MIANPKYDFLEVDYVNPNLCKKGKVIEEISELNKPSKLAISGAATAMLITPSIVLASDGTFGNVHDAVMNLFDSAVVLIIIFSGASWMLGHRSKAIELLIGAGCGYLIARHAIDIRDFLKSI